MSNSNLGLVAFALRGLDRWLLSRLLQIGFIEDELLNVVDFDGNASDTLSLHAANAAMNKPPEKWACILCKILSRMVQKDHCKLVLDPNFVMPETSAALAFFWITCALLLTFGISASLIIAILHFIFT